MQLIIKSLETDSLKLSSNSAKAEDWMSLAYYHILGHPTFLHDLGV